MDCTYLEYPSSTEEWLAALNMGRHAHLFAELSVSDLPDLTDARLKMMGISIIGHRRRILMGAAKVATLREGFTASTEKAEEAASSASHATTSPPTSAWSGASSWRRQRQRLEQIAEEEPDALLADTWPLRDDIWLIADGLQSRVTAALVASVASRYPGSQEPQWSSWRRRAWSAGSFDPLHHHTPEGGLGMVRRPVR